MDCLSLQYSYTCLVRGLLMDILLAILLSLFLHRSKRLVNVRNHVKRVCREAAGVLKDSKCEWRVKGCRREDNTAVSSPPSCPPCHFLDVMMFWDVRLLLEHWGVPSCRTVCPRIDYYQRTMRKHVMSAADLSMICVCLYRKVHVRAAPVEESIREC